MSDCPVCKAPARTVEHLDAERIGSAIVAALPDHVPSYTAPRDYALARCSSCTLEFAVPMQPGDDSFYNWICSSRHYYPHARWEWTPLLDTLQREHRQQVLDVGCGSGLFLAAVRARGLRGLGVDATPASVQACRDKGLDALCVDLQSIESVVTDRFDAVTLFHVVEHLADPAAALGILRRLLKPGGVIAVSVPYSPMSFETDWHDPLNRPPHHLTRWNTASLTALAKAAGLQARIIVQPSRSPLARTLSTLQLIHQLPAVEDSFAVRRTARLLMRLGRRPLQSFGIWSRQRKRDRDLAGPKGDAVLVLLSEPSH